MPKNIAKLPLTPWFPSEINPARKGAYDVADGALFVVPWFKYWNGRHWGMGAKTPIGAVKRRSDPVASQSGFHWRGLAVDPNAEK